MAVEKPRLGAETHYPESYDPDLLVSIPRSAGRSELVIPCVMHGVDVWTGYELSWLNSRGKPRVAIAEFSISSDSEFIVESKSFKLYLNSLNQYRIDSTEQLVALMTRDLSRGFGGPVAITLYSVDEYARRGVSTLLGECLDDLDVACDHYQTDGDLLRADSAEITREQLYSHLLKSNCPVTGQPDWASVVIEYSGGRIDREGLLKYLVSFRQHQDFHENCVETLFCELIRRCRPDSLTVYARYTRRGGLDINPYRSTAPLEVGFCRLARQ